MISQLEGKTNSRWKSNANSSKKIGSRPTFRTV